MDAPLSLRDYEREARARLAPEVFDFFAGGAEDERTLRENELAYARLALLPRVLCGAEKRDLGVELLGRRLELPVLLSPTAFHRLAHAEGECATARAAAAAGTVMILSMAATRRIEDVAAAASELARGDAPPLWFQLFLQPDLGFTRAIVERAAAAGCDAIVLTVDAPVLGRRERDLRNGFIDLPDGLCCENLREEGSDAVRAIHFESAFGWTHLEWLRSVTPLPIVVKGVVHPDDARLALEHGADAVVVSNHGGRQLDTVPATIDLLPAVAEALDGRVPLLVDGGVRRGSDVVKALARGATAVGIGRPVLWGLAADGEAGVARVLALLRDEIDRALALCGVASPAEVSPGLVRSAACRGDAR